MVYARASTETGNIVRLRQPRGFHPESDYSPGYLRRTASQLRTWTSVSRELCDARSRLSRYFTLHLNLDFRTSLTFYVSLQPIWRPTSSPREPSILQSTRWRTSSPAPLSVQALLLLQVDILRVQPLPLEPWQRFLQA